MTDNQPTSAEAILDGAQEQVLAQAQKTPEEIAREYDLLPKLIPHLDRHLVFPLLEFISSQEGESAEETTKAKYELLKETNMTDYIANLWQEIHHTDEIPEQFVKKREEVLQRLQLYMEETSKITELLENPDVVNSLRSDKVANLQYLKDQHGVGIFWVFIWDEQQAHLISRLLLKWSTCCMTLEGFNTVVVATEMLLNGYINSEFWYVEARGYNSRDTYMR